MAQAGSQLRGTPGGGLWIRCSWGPNASQRCARTSLWEKRTSLSAPALGWMRKKPRGETQAPRDTRFQERAPEPHSVHSVCDLLARFLPFLLPVPRAVAQGLGPCDPLVLSRWQVTSRGEDNGLNIQALDPPRSCEALDKLSH